MIEDIKKLLDRYAVWLRDKTHLRDVGNNFVEITTPYLDRHNDYLQIYVRKEDGSYLLTDGGSTIQDLEASGCELETKKRRDLLTQTLSGFGVQLDNDERLLVRATNDNFPLRKHNLVQAILGVNDLWGPRKTRCFSGLPSCQVGEAVIFKGERQLFSHGLSGSFLISRSSSVFCSFPSRPILLSCSFSPPVESRADYAP